MSDKQVKDLLNEFSGHLDDLSMSVMAMSDVVTDVLDKVAEFVDDVAEGLPVADEPVEEVSLVDMYEYLCKYNPGFYGGPVVEGFLKMNPETMRSHYEKAKKSAGSEEKKGLPPYLQKVLDEWIQGYYDERR